MGLALAPAASAAAPDESVHYLADRLTDGGDHLVVESGETISVVGHSGTGKSVLLKHLIGLLTPDAGRVVVDGEPLDALPYAGLRRVRRKPGRPLVAAVPERVAAAGGEPAQGAHR